MKVGNVLPLELNNLKGADIFTHGHLPVAAAYCRKLGLIDLVNQLVPSQMLLKPGLVVQAMVLDTLSGRSPLYHLEDFMAQQDIELLLGTPVTAKAFNDTNLARSLDAIFDAGPSKILTALGVRATKEFSLDTKIVSYDTTSTSVWGEYKNCENDSPPPGPIITHGFSKDHLPELKQFMTELLCVERGIPIFGKTLDGNSSDKNSNNLILSNISTLMAKHGFGVGAFIYVSDSAMVTEKNLEAADSILFVSRLPSNYSECQRVMELAVTSDQWVDLGKLAEMPSKSKNRPCALYKVFETSVKLYEKTYRALVVHSSSHDKRRKKKLDKAIAESARSLNARLTKFSTTFFCEADAKVAAQKAEALSGKLHLVKTTICTEEVRKKGRPPEKGPAPTTTKYRLSWALKENNTAIEREKQLAGCFVLLTTVPTTGEEAMDSKKLLLTYKGQYGVESDFAFLKDPLIVNDTFLKKPWRIDALGMVLVIALMVWRLMERSMRAHIEENKTQLIGWDKKKTNKPTAYMVTRVLLGIMVAVIGGKRVLLNPPGKRQMEFIEALGLGLDVFVDSGCICKPIIPQQLTGKG